ncbi:MAG: hypothetical protein JWO87_1338 [Phycisphaerales bacterium]|nr:hypothetical protein [Phycisphaerales bacterium]
MSLSNDVISRTARLLFSTLMAWTWCGGINQVTAAPSAPAAAAPLAGADLARLADQLEEGLKALEVASRNAPRDSFDPQAVLANVGRDRDALFAWVRDQTAYVPYDGLLRGPRGVLMERAGNSLDRALLLAELLRSAGQPVRLARAALTDAQRADAAARLKASLQARPQPADAAPQPPVAPGDTNVDPGMNEALLLSQGLAEDSAARIERDVTVLNAAIGAQGGPGHAAATAPVAADHWWVQARAGEGWVDLDPTLADAKVGQTLAPSQSTCEIDPKTGVPILKEALSHEVELRVIVEQWKDGKLQEKPVLQHVLRPAEMAGRQATLIHVPPGWSDNAVTMGTDDSMKKLVAAAAAQTEWRPMLLIGEEFVVQSTFTTEGEVSKSSSDDPFAKLGSTLGKAIGGFDVLGGEAPAATKGVLTAEWIEYEIRVPGRPAKTIRRAVFDLLSPSARGGAAVDEPKVDQQTAANRGFALMGETELLVLGSRLSIGFVEHAVTATLLESKAALLDVLRHAQDDGLRGTAKRGAKLHPQTGPLHALALARHLWNARADEAYLDRPNVLTYQKKIRLGPDGKIVTREGFDIVENAVAARPGSADPFQAVLRQGVADTVAEAVVLQRPMTENVSELVSHAQAQGVGMSAVARVEDLGTRAAGLSAGALGRARQDLSAGSLLVMPERAGDVGGRPVVGWYRVDRATGQTLGVIASGEGAAMIEYIAVVVGVSNGLLTTYGCGGFAAGASNTKIAACLACGCVVAALTAITIMVMWGGAGGALGGWVSGKGGTAASIGLNKLCNVVSGAMS